MRVLAIDDDPMVSQWVEKVLGETGYAVDVASTASDGNRLALSIDYDLALIDLDLPDGSGLAIVQAIRRTGRKTPIIIMTGRADDDGIIAGLDAGADDYLVKPVANGVLRARVRAALRRGGAVTMDTLAIGQLSMDRVRHMVRAGDKILPLSPKEFRLLEYFMERPEQVVPRADLLERVWGVRFDTFTNVVDTTVSRLRQKLATALASPTLRTVRGTGFVLSSTPEP